MSRRPSPNPTKAAIYQRRWRAKNPLPPRPPSPSKLAKQELEALLGDKLCVARHKADIYREKQKQRYRWNAVLDAGKDLVFTDRGCPKTYSYADALYQRDHKPERVRTPQAEYQRQYREKRKAELPENVALPILLEHLPENLHETLHGLLRSLRRSPAPPPEPKAEPPKTLSLEEKVQAVLAAGHDLIFDGEVFDYEDAVWQRDHP